MPNFSIITINASDGHATWFTLARQFTPRAERVTNREQILKSADRKLHATL